MRNVFTCTNTQEHKHVTKKERLFVSRLNVGGWEFGSFSFSKPLREKTRKRHREREETFLLQTDRVPRKIQGKKRKEL